MTVPPPNVRLPLVLVELRTTSRENGGAGSSQLLITSVVLSTLLGGMPAYGGGGTWAFRWTSRPKFQRLAWTGTEPGAYHRHRLHHLLAPRSIAVLGVSARRRNIGAIVMDNIRAAGFRGRVTGVGRERATVAGQPVVPSLDEVGGADLLVVSVPASQVVGALKAGSALGIRNYAIITAGFAESHQAGAEVQAEIRQLSAADDLAVLGPNTVGFINYRAKVNASFAPWWKLDRPPGDVAIISQSGGTAGAIMVLGAKGGARFGYVVGSGNEAVLDLVDYLDYIGADPRIRTIAIYSEGWRRGRNVVARIAQLRETGKLVVVLSAARSVSAARAAVSHTASLATPGDVSRQVLESVGAIVVDTPQDAGATLAMLSSKRPLPHGQRLLVCADAGGSGVLSSDLAEKPAYRCRSCPLTRRPNWRSTFLPSARPAIRWIRRRFYSPISLS